MALRGSRLLVAFALFAFLSHGTRLQSQGPGAAFKVVDKDSGAVLTDATVTVDGGVVRPNPSRDYELPSGTHTTMVRAAGHRAGTFSAAEIVAAKGRLALSPFTVRALYLTEYGIASRALRDGALGIIRHGGANALVINIKSDSGLLPYPSAIPLAKEIGARKMTTIRSLPDLVTGLHEQGIYAIARIVTFKDNPLATAHPEWAARLQNGSLFKDREHLSWTDPFNAEVRAYNIAIAVEAAKAGFDEVQFDYVRFPDAATKLQFSKPADQATARVEAITSFLQDARKALLPYNVFLSADIFGYVAWNKNDTGIGQSITDISSAVDYVCLMLYPSGFKYGIPGHRNPLVTDDDIYNTVKLSLDEAIKRTGASPRKFRPWLQAFRDYAFNRREFGASEVATQIRAASDAGSSGWTLWNARNDYTKTGLVKPEK